MNQQILHTGVAAAQCNMMFDFDLLHQLPQWSHPVLHLYEWSEECATYGYFLQPEGLFAEDCNLTLARRPTGGGILFHTTDFAFSILVPSSHPAFSHNTLNNYAYVNQLVADVIERFSGERTELFKGEHDRVDPDCGQFCMATPTQYDVMIEGRKVAGGAQRRTRHGFLHQGTISLAPPQTELLANRNVARAMQRVAYPLLGDSCSQREFFEARREISQLLVARFSIRGLNQGGGDDFNRGYQTQFARQESSLAQAP